MDIIAKLNELSELQAARDVTALDKQAKIDVILKPLMASVQADLDAIAAEFDPLLETVEPRIATLQAEIKTEVIASGASVKGDHVQAVYTKGRVTWDTKAIDGYTAGHPELLSFRKEGDPSVSFRVVK